MPSPKAQWRAKGKGKRPVSRIMERALQDIRRQEEVSSEARRPKACDGDTKRRRPNRDGGGDSAHHDDTTPHDDHLIGKLSATRCPNGHCMLHVRSNASFGWMGDCDRCACNWPVGTLILECQEFHCGWWQCLDEQSCLENLGLSGWQWGDEGIEERARAAKDMRQDQARSQDLDCEWRPPNPVK